MEKTKQIGDKVWIIEDNKIREGIIEAIDYHVSFKKLSNVGYVHEFNTTRSDDEIFTSKEELIESLNK